MRIPHPRRAGCALFASAAMVALWVGQTQAYERYRVGGGGCFTCHGDFTGPVSPRGSVFPGDDKHKMHRGGGAGEMDTDCDLCHTSGDGHNPYIGSSDGTANNPGLGCTGCHGRNYPGIGDSGVGLRAHHIAAGTTLCGICHPGDPIPLTENVIPTYYGTQDTRVVEPCNPAAQSHPENFTIGDTIGLDNDGDLDYDESDSDCSGVLLGDMDCNGVVNEADIPNFITALIDPANFPPGCDILNGDMDGNGTANGMDTQGFVDALTN